MTQIKAEKYENDVKSKQIGQSDKLPDRNGRSAINSLKKKKKRRHLIKTETHTKKASTQAD